MQSGPSTFTSVGLIACDQDSRLTLEQYDAQIRWTSYGIPQKQMIGGSLGFGFAYATARDAVCVIAKDVQMVNGEFKPLFWRVETKFGKRCISYFE